MPKRNGYLDNFIPHFYQRNAHDIMAFTFIDTYKFIQPSVTIYEAASAFIKRYKIDEDLHSLNSIIMTYNRMLNQYYDGQKTENKTRNTGT